MENKLSMESEATLKIKQLETKIQQLEKLLYRGNHKEWVFHTLYQGGNITINDINGKGVQIQVDHMDTIADIKTKFSNKIHTPVGDLYSGRNLLQNHQTLFHYLIPTKSILSHVPFNEHKPPTLPSLQERFDQHINKFYTEEYIRLYIYQKNYEQRYGFSSKFKL